MIPIWFVICIYVCYGYYYVALEIVLCYTLFVSITISHSFNSFTQPKFNLFNWGISILVGLLCGLQSVCKSIGTRCDHPLALDI